ncbi:hypothetical protein, partial [Streptomyces lasiicapitis]|uniref:hypothetical protein n=1 Tax=Streptomyces lasiicapitis TaxID=1923961 RepID=UPI0036B27CF3
MRENAVRKNVVRKNAVRKNALRKKLAAVRMLIGTAKKVDRRRGLLVLIISPLLNVVAALQAVGLQWMVDGAGADHRAPTVPGARERRKLTLGITHAPPGAAA